MNRLTTLLDARVFPAIKAYVSAHAHILAIIALLPILLWPGISVTLSLAANSYLNCASAAVSCIVLAESLHHRQEVRHLHRKLDILHRHIVSADTTTKEQERH